MGVEGACFCFFRLLIPHFKVNKTKQQIQKNNNKKNAETKLYCSHTAVETELLSFLQTGPPTLHDLPPLSTGSERITRLPFLLLLLFPPLSLPSSVQKGTKKNYFVTAMSVY